ncbi:MAG: hypothetical protein JWO13_1996 [Acidobacteriales bacterium]|nr:hypothetical protein [Terriglobales bacterium]
MNSIERRCFFLPRPSWRIVLLVCAFVGVGPNIIAQSNGVENDKFWKEIHHKDDTVWAQKSGLSVETVRKLRLEAGVPDDLHETRIDNIDAKTLRSRHQIFIVTSAGNGHCLTLNILTEQRKRIHLLWRLSELPDGAGFCHERMLPYPSAYVSKDQKVLVNIPSYADDESETGRALRIITYKWTGSTYQFASDQRVVSEK